MRHAVLQADDKAVRGQNRLDQLAGPAGIIGFDHQKHEVERLFHLRHLAQVERGNLGVDLAGRHVDGDAVRPDRLYMGGPLIDKGHIQPGQGKVGGDRGTLCPGAQKRDAGGFCRMGQEALQLFQDDVTFGGKGGDADGGVTSGDGWDVGLDLRSNRCQSGPRSVSVRQNVHFHVHPRQIRHDHDGPYGELARCNFDVQRLAKQAAQRQHCGRQSPAAVSQSGLGTMLCGTGIATVESHPCRSSR